MNKVGGGAKPLTIGGVHLQMGVWRTLWDTQRVYGRALEITSNSVLYKCLLS